MPLLESAAFITSVLGVWLTTQRKMLCWPVGLLSVLLYGWVFWQAKLYSDGLLQLAFASLSIYGWYRWSQHPFAKTKTLAEKIRIKRIPRSAAAIHLLIGTLGGAMLGYLMSKTTDAALPWMDSALTGFSLIAEFWKARQYIGAWWLWIMVDIIYVGVYEFKKLHLTAALYLIFIVLAIFGLRRWQRALNLQAIQQTIRSDSAP